jgi:LacI family transcriptional regulator
MRTTVRDVAREAGVSHRTVVNVLNGRQNETSPATRERVLNVARELNYIPVAQPATQHRHVETRIIGLVFDSVDWESYWGMRTFQGLREGAKKHGYDLLTILRESPDWATNQQELRFLDRRSDGLIFMAPRNRDDVFKALIEHNIPAVSCYMDDVPEGVACITVDNVEAMRMAVHYLVEMGHERILFLASNAPRSDFKHRIEGYLLGMEEAKLAPNAVPLDLNGNWHPRALAEIKDREATAVICIVDMLAYELQEYLEQQGWKIPDDLSLVGMDDIPVSAERGLTTIRISGADVGRLSIESMVELIGGGKAENSHKVAPVEMVYRNTVARCTR